MWECWKPSFLVFKEGVGFCWKLAFCFQQTSMAASFQWRMVLICKTDLGCFDFAKKANFRHDAFHCDRLRWWNLSRIKI